MGVFKMTCCAGKEGQLPVIPLIFDLWRMLLRDTTGKIAEIRQQLPGGPRIRRRAQMD